jgi:flagellar protein FliS
MQAAKIRSAYQKSEAQAHIHPVKLIHLLYERVLVHLELAEQAVISNDAKVRGENLSKAIAILSELNASVTDAEDSEAASFLRGMYSAILLELPKVAISFDVQIVRRSHRYLTRMLEIWEATAMAEAGLDRHQHDEPPIEDNHPLDRGNSSPSVCSEYGACGPKKFKIMGAAACYMHGVSVSI